jgi:general secretion pathway protein C
VLGDTKKEESLVILADPQTGKQTAYPTGETIQGYRIMEVSRGRVVFEREGRQHILELAGASSEGLMPDDAAMTPCGPSTERWPYALEDTDKLMQLAIASESANARWLDRCVVWSAIKDHSWKLMDSVEVQPAFVDGELVGMQVDSMPDRGILFQSGLRPGDIIESVNGQSTLDGSLLTDLPAQLLRVNSLEVRVYRNGAPLLLTYRVQ